MIIMMTILLMVIMMLMLLMVVAVMITTRILIAMMMMMMMIWPQLPLVMLQRHPHYHPRSSDPNIRPHIKKRKEKEKEKKAFHFVEACPRIYYRDNSMIFRLRDISAFLLMCAYFVCLFLLFWFLYTSLAVLFWMITSRRYFFLMFRNAFIHRLKGCGEHKRGTVSKGSEPKKHHGTHSGFSLIHFVQNQCLEVVNTPLSVLPVCAQQCQSVLVTS